MTLVGVPEDQRIRTNIHAWRDDSGHATLGILWQIFEDIFAFKVNAAHVDCATERTVLAQTARLFDPLGWLAPVIISAKILIQSIWLQQLDLDQPLGASDERKWRDLEEKLPLLERIRISRWLHTSEMQQQRELHRFADASERAYAAIIYLRVKEENGVQTSLLMAKTKVAPIKQILLPRLEFCAAALLTKLMAYVREVLETRDLPIHLWTDSTVTVCWIQSHPSRWKTYVANRVSEIQRTLPEAQWHHLPSKDNPADCASRGMSPDELLRHKLWWRRPKQLRCEEVSDGGQQLQLNDKEMLEQQIRAHTVC